jgi:hypothetical protein
MIPIAKYLKTHEAADNATDYRPVWTDGTYNHNALGSVGSYSPLWFGVHNYSGAQDVTIWTIDQGLVADDPSSTPLAGVTVHILQGETFYARIAKIEVSNPVTLLGTANYPSTL